MDDDTIATHYVLLALRIDQQFPGFVDGYYGPAELREQAAGGERRELAALAADADALLDALAAADLDAQRRQYLTCQTVAMRTVIRKLQGEDLPLVEETRLLFDVTPERVPEATFDRALAEMDRLLPGSGPVLDRLTAWDRSLEVPRERLSAALDLVMPEIRRRTYALFDLPPGEAVETGLVTDQPWSGYNWYLGGYRSRIEVNTDLPVSASWVPELLAHEAYPGHHTEHAIKEHRLYRQSGRLEHGVLLLNAPECVISEGLADVALEVIFPEAELVVWLGEVFLPACGLDRVDPSHVLAIARVHEALKGVRGNAAFLLHVDGRSETEVVDYLQHYGLRTEAQARQAIRFLIRPLYRAYTFTYFYGEQLVRQFLGRGDRRTGFGRLLAEPLMPSSLREQT